ncbi:MAG: P1 family peptidase [Spirochaetales bacterium]|jgi:L-aminopeptidase/D-esterase-like protein|nr:P1 family peptidase [Spirochaetales bacterium]
MLKKLFIFCGLFSLALSGFASPRAETSPPPEPAPASRPAADSAQSTGPHNAITDVAGVLVGSYQRNHTGTTVIIFSTGGVGGVDVRGSSPGTRETDLLRPTDQVDNVNAIVLSGGSAYGLAAADGVMLWLEERGMGWPVGGGNVVPIVPSAILFDPGRFDRPFNERPTAEFGRRAADAAAAGPVAMGNVGAGAGAVAGGLKGGLGTASVDLGNGVIVGALVAINSAGSTVHRATGEFYGAYLEIGDEFGGLGAPFAGAGGAPFELAGAEPVKNTTIAVVATNIELTKAQAQKIAQMAHDGFARAMSPAHTMYDGDTIFAVGTGEITQARLSRTQGWEYMNNNVNKVGAAAADCIVRAIIHAMLNAQTVGTVQSYLDAYPGAR